MCKAQGFLSFSTALTLLMLFALGCGDRPSPSPNPAGQSTGSKSNAEPGEVPADESLNADEYVRLGLPAYDRRWSAGDMAKAEKVLASLAQAACQHLPRYQSKRSGAVFARITSAKNLERFRKSNSPLDTRLSEVRDYIQAFNEINKLYGFAFLKKKVANGELVELMGAQFRSTVVAIELVNKLHDDPRHAAGMQDFEGMKQGLASIVAGGLQALTDHESYRRSELARLVGYMQETFPVIVPWLPPDARAEAMIRLEKLHEDPALRELQPRLKELRSQVKASVERAER
jgi:hypothetical protein